jgi:uracil phosphoribosyltransferase
VKTLDHIPVVKHLLSVLRDKETRPAEFRIFSDRIMRLLIEEAIATELDNPTRK